MFRTDDYPSALWQRFRAKLGVDEPFASLLESCWRITVSKPSPPRRLLHILEISERIAIVETHFEHSQHDHT